MSDSLPDRFEKAEVARLLVPIDGSELSARAVPIARLLASQLGADLAFVAVATFDDETRLLGQAVAAAAEGFDSVVLDGDDVAGEILRAAGTLPGTVVCMASHGRGRSAGILGSVASEVVARTREPVILIGPRVERRSPVERLVACVDGSRDSEDVLPVAAGWAGSLGAPLSIVTVAEPLPEPVSAGRRSDTDPSAPRAPERYLRSLASVLEESGVSVETRTLYDPVGVAAGLSGFLEQHPSSLVALATHARTGLRRLAQGSTAATLVHKLEAPVLLVRENGRGIR